MQMIPLGKVAVASAGTLQQLSTETAVNRIILKAGSGNTNKVYLGFQGLAKATLANCFWELSPGGEFDSAQFGLNDIDPSKIYLDADTSGNYVTGALMVR